MGLHPDLETMRKRGTPFSADKSTAPPEGLSRSLEYRPGPEVNYEDNTVVDYSTRTGTNMTNNANVKRYHSQVMIYNQPMISR